MTTFACADIRYDYRSADGTLGSYDGSNNLDLYLHAQADATERRLTALHEWFHYKLHSATVWGLTATVASVLADHNVNRAATRRLAITANTTCRDVQEIWATTQSCYLTSQVWGDESLIASNPQYLAYLRRGVALSQCLAPAHDQFRALVFGALGLGLMQSADLAERAQAGVEKLRLRDLSPDIQPDQVLKRFTSTPQYWWEETIGRVADSAPAFLHDPLAAEEMDESELDAAIVAIAEWTQAGTTIAYDSVRNQLAALGFAALSFGDLHQYDLMLRETYAGLVPPMDPEWASPDAFDTSLRIQPWDAGLFFGHSHVIHEAPAKLVAADATEIRRSWFPTPVNLWCALSGQALDRQFDHSLDIRARDAVVFGVSGRAQETPRTLPMLLWPPGTTLSHIATTLEAHPPHELVFFTTFTTASIAGLSGHTELLGSVFVLVDVPLVQLIGFWKSIGLTVRHRLQLLPESFKVTANLLQLQEEPNITFLVLGSDDGAFMIHEALSHEDTFISDANLCREPSSKLPVVLDWLRQAWWRFEEYAK